MFRNSTACALAVCTAAPLALSGEPDFSSQQRSYPTGLTTSSQSYYPQGHALADLDGDGDLDALVSAVGNWTNPRFAVLLNLGDGSFAAPLFAAISGECADVAVGDFDADGTLDAAFCVGGYGTGSQHVGLFFGRGDGTFDPEVAVPCGRGPTGIVAFDADRDGDTDLATANWYWNESDISVLYNDGAGGFGVRQDFPIAGTQPYKLAAGDIDGDLWADLAVSVRNGSPAAALLRNDGAGGFQPPSLLPQAAGAGVNDVPGIALADIDRDSDLDVLVSQGGNVGLWGSIGIFRNSGTGNFAPLEARAVEIGSGHDFAIGDVTGDGWPDVLCTAHSGNYGYALLAGDGAGGFAVSRNFRAGEWARSIALGDVDLDGDLDVSVINSGSLTMTVHTNEPGGLRMPYAVTTAAFTSSIATGDIDHDGDVDAVTCDNRIWQLFNDGSGSFSPSLQSMSGGSRSFCKLRDVNGDGWLDLLAKSSSVQIALGEGAAFPGFFQPFADASGALGAINDFETLDFDNDGDLDIAATLVGSNTERVGVLPNLGNGSWGTPIRLSAPTLTGGTPLVTGDFDNDGRADIVYGNGNAVAWRNTGNGNFSGPLVSPAGGGFVRMAAGDFDGDGRLDLAGVNYDYNGQGENLIVMRGLGNLSFAAPQVHYGMFSIQYGGTTGLALLDADADGDLDIACSAYGDNELVLFRNQGAGTFAPALGYGVQGVAKWIHAADVDADGALDLLANIGTEPPIGGALTVLFARPDPTVPRAYCTAGTSTNGCAPAIAGIGKASASGATQLLITVQGVEGQRVGLIFYGQSGRAQLAWGTSSSFLCVKSPTQRTLAQSSGGSLFNCDGQLSLDWNAFQAAHPGALGQPFSAGDVVRAQGWYRDPPSPKTTQLSDALEFALTP